ncbi:MAG TPA: glycerate kinase [Dehalococcoidia bacterium]|nr:glycerate kinase [Dehalococcoidia bacterium]
MRILVCPQEFKGSLTAPEAARAISDGIRREMPDAEIIEAPTADGGPGTVALVHATSGGELIDGRWRGPLGEAVDAAYALLPDGSAVIEAATVAGLVLVPEADRDPGVASTYGVGEQIGDALRQGARHITVGVGGTGTNDGGAGAAQALGLRLLDGDGSELAPGGLALGLLARIDATDANPLLADAELRVAVDVSNRLLGPEGATAIYGPQKGVTPELVPRLEAALARWADRCAADLDVDIATIDGSGAGGGLPAGLIAAAGGTIASGATIVGQAIGLPQQIAAADLVVTGEGRLDAQTAYGKAVAYVAGLADASDRPCLAVGGTIDAIPPQISDAEAAAPDGMPVDQAMARAAELVAGAARRLIQRHAV